MDELRFGKFFFVSALMIGGGYLIWQWISPEITARYELTLFVTVNGIIKTGSGVFELTATNNWILPEGGAWSGYAKGEALGIDLGAQGALVVTLAADDARKPSRGVEGLFDLIAGPFPNGSLASDWLWQITLSRLPIELRLDQLPMVVWFHDRFDPTSLERVVPSVTELTSAPSIRFVRATVQIVPRGYWPFNYLGPLRPQWLFGVPVSSGLDNLLPWLRGWKGGNFLLNPSRGADSYGLPPEYALDKTAFTRRVK